MSKEKKAERMIMTEDSRKEETENFGITAAAENSVIGYACWTYCVLNAMDVSNRTQK